MTAIKQAANKFYIGDKQTPKAEITFKRTDENHLTVDHTFVSDELRGGGIAGKLVDRVVNYAREEGKKIIPECSYAKKKIENTSAYHDVLAEE